MKFGHLVKYNGVYYPAGTDVPMEVNGGGNAPAEKTSGKVDNMSVVKKSPLKKTKYTEKDFEKKKYFELKSMAKKEGFDVAKNATSDELKKMLLSVEV